MLKQSHEKKKKKSERVSCSVLSNSLWPTDHSLPGSSVHRILQARILEWVAIPFSRGSSHPRNGTQISCIKSSSLLSEPPGQKAHMGLQKPIVKFSGILQDKNIYTMENRTCYKSKCPTSAPSPCQRASLPAHNYQKTLIMDLSSQKWALTIFLWTRFYLKRNESCLDYASGPHLLHSWESGEHTA